MALHPGLRGALIAIVSLAYATVGGFSVLGALRQLERVANVGQLIGTYAQFGLGVMTLGAVASPFFGLINSHRVRVAWGIAFVIVAGGSSLIWGPPMPLVALFFALVAAAIAWGLDRASHHILLG